MQTIENKRLLDKIIRRWMRMILGKADSYRRQEPREAAQAQDVDADGLDNPQPAQIARSSSNVSTGVHKAGLSHFIARGCGLLR